MYLKFLLVAHTTQVTLCQTLYMLLCVSLVWPTKFANTLSFYAKQIWCLRIYGECLKILILGKLGLKLLFLKQISSHTHAFWLSISMLWDFPKMYFCFFSKLCFSQKFCESLSVSIDWVCFSINRNWFKKFRWASVCFDRSNLRFRSIENRMRSF